MRYEIIIIDADENTLNNLKLLIENVNESTTSNNAVILWWINRNLKDQIEDIIREHESVVDLDSAQNLLETLNYEDHGCYLAGLQAEVDMARFSWEWDREKPKQLATEINSHFDGELDYGKCLKLAEKILTEWT